VIILVLRSGRRPVAAPDPAPGGAGRTYLISVVAMLAAFPVGGWLFTRVFDQPALVLPWVVLAVGLHFLPFARAFRAGIFAALAWTLIAIAVVGGVLTVLVDPRASPWTGVAAGFALLAFSAVGAIHQPESGGRHMASDDQHDSGSADAAVHRLATYGSLAPGRVNHFQLDGLNGRWTAGHVKGTLIDRGWGAGLGYPAIILDPNGSSVEVQVFESTDLPDHWPRLDGFEGSGYSRVVASVSTSEGDIPAYIYVLADHAGGES
jgi:gamma-glutamylcyclotransferase (GGCT)/AIG2-like uncharacterized protein YtfP